jgi:hypothetical protein
MQRSLDILNTNEMLLFILSNNPVQSKFVVITINSYASYTIYKINASQYYHLYCKELCIQIVMQKHTTQLTNRYCEHNKYH